MHKIFYCIAVMMFSLHAQNNGILILRSNESKYKKIEFGIKSELMDKTTIRSVVPSNEAEIVNVVATQHPDAVIVMDGKYGRLWKKIREKHPEINLIPSIMLGSGTSNLAMDNMSNCCIVTYEPKLEHYIDKVVHLTGNRPRNIGVFSSSMSGGMAQAYLEESIRLKVNLYAIPVVVSDPENSIQSILNDFIGHYHVDFMIVLDDDALINDQSVGTTWKRLLSPLKMQVAIPSDYLYELEPRIGSFAIQPHYTEIGRVVASVINDAEANNWTMRQKTVYTDKSIFYFRNNDGSVGKRDQSQNDIVVAYHQKTATVSETKLPVNSEAISNSRQVFASSDVSSRETVTPSITNQPPISPVANATTKQLPLRSTATNNSLTVDREKITPATMAVVNDKQVKNQFVSKNNDVKKQAPQPTSLSEIPPPDSTISNDNNYGIEIIALKTNIYRALSPDFPVLGIGRCGDKLKIFSEDSQWYRVDFFGIPGFLAKTDAKIITQEKIAAQAYTFNRVPVTIAIITLLALAFAIWILIRARNMRHYKSIRLNCLLVARKTKLIRYSNINAKRISLVKYLKNYGFNTMLTGNINQLNNMPLLDLPDVICVDWRFDIDIQEKIYEILKERMFTENFILIFYNILDPSTMMKKGFFGDRTFFLTEDFIISDLNAVLSMTKNDPDTLQQVPEQPTSCLEGKISDETITDILQLMDINKKTGCLLFEHHHPVGMIFFEDGIITYAITNSLVGEQAVFDILSMKHGKFQFIPGKKPITRQMHLEIVTVLMEKAKLMDEKSNG